VTAALVLAAGEGRRFGGPKQLAELDGRPLLQHAVDAARAAPGVDRVVVVLGARAAAIRAAVRLGGAEVVEAADWAEGMSASLRAGLHAVPAADRVVVLLGDQPRVGAEVIAEALRRAPADRPLRATYGGAPGHPVVLPRTLLGEAAALRGEHGARDLLRGAATFEAAHLCDPTDIDTTADLEAMRP
jgi:molybdenum cofactor cytidylyltransferase